MGLDSKGEFRKKYILAEGNAEILGISVFVKKPGEYVFLIKAEENGRELDSQTFFIISEANRTCIAGADWSSCLWNFVLNNNNIPTDPIVNGIRVNVTVDDIPFNLKNKVLREYKEAKSIRAKKIEHTDKYGSKLITISTSTTDISLQPKSIGFFARITNWLIKLFK